MDNAFLLAESSQAHNMLNEIEGRWNLVESAWTERNPNLEVNYDTSLEQFFFVRPISPRQFMHSHERISLTAARKPLNGYQKGKCFYCYRPITIESGKDETCDIDHFVPLSFQYDNRLDLQLNGVWNLVLSCQDCNRGEGTGKFRRLPSKKFLERLHKRNEFLVNSNHPLKETIIMQSGRHSRERAAFLNTVFEAAGQFLSVDWQPAEVWGEGF